MVLKIDGPLMGAFFVTSDKQDPKLQRSELTSWVDTNGYRPYGADFVYTIYRDGKPVREWRHVQTHSN